MSSYPMVMKHLTMQVTPSAAKVESKNFDWKEFELTDRPVFVERDYVLTELRWFMQDGDIDKIENLITKLGTKVGSKLTAPSAEKE
jgi:hypothetical protein